MKTVAEGWFTPSWIIATLFGALLTQTSSAQFASLTADSRPMSAESIPSSGTFWISSGTNGVILPPYPRLPAELSGSPVYDLGGGQFLVADEDDVTGPPSPTGGGTNTNSYSGTIVSNTPPAPCVPSELWSYGPMYNNTEDDFVVNIPYTFGTNGDIFISQSDPNTLDDVVTCLDTASLITNSTPRWQIDLGSIGMSGRMVVGDDGTVYMAGSGGMIALNPADGSTNWMYQIPGWIIGNTNHYGFCQSIPAIAPDGAVIVTDGDQGKLWRFVNGTNYTNWGVPNSFNGGSPFSFPALRGCIPIVGPDGTVFVGTATNRFGIGYILAVTNLAAGGGAGVKWSLAFTNQMFSDYEGTFGMSDYAGLGGPNFALTVAGTLYSVVRPASIVNAFLTNAAIASIQADTGSLNWVCTNFGTTVHEISPLSIGPDGSIYSVEGPNSVPSYVCAINPSGTFKWSFTNDNFEGCSPVVSSDGSIWALSSYGTLYQLNGMDGTEITNVTIGYGPLEGIPLMLGNDGVLYAEEGFEGTVSLSGYQTCSPVSCSSWPQYQKNLRHTARQMQRSLTNPGYTNGVFSASLSGTNGSWCEECVGTNLVNWTNLQTIRFTSSATNLTDTNASNFQARFYRPIIQ